MARTAKTDFDRAETLDEIDRYSSLIDNAVIDFVTENDISDLRKETQNVFNACLSYIYQHVFKPCKDDYIRYPIKNSKIDYDNIDLIYGILYKYIYICDLYSKSVNVLSFSHLTGIDITVIYDWYNKTLRADNPLYANIYKILDRERERSLTDLLASGIKQPVGLLAILNKEKGWALPGTTKEVHHVASVESPEKVAERYRSRLADKGENDG